MSERVGREAPVIFSAILTIHCRVFRSAAVQLPNYVVMAESSRRKYRLCWAFFVMCLVFRVHVKLSVMCTPRNFVLWTISTGRLLMHSGVRLGGVRLKSMTSSFVLSTLRDRLLSVDQLLCCTTSSLYRALLSPQIKPSSVLSSANLMMWFELRVAAQSWVRSVNSRGLSTQPWGGSCVQYGCVGGPVLNPHFLGSSYQEV